jgi:hypothetical protein
MKPFVYITATLSFLIGGSLTFAIIRWLSKGSPELAFVAGAILGTELAAVVHHRTPGASSSPAVKAKIAAALSVSAIFLGIALHTAFHPFAYPEISIPMAVAGAFIFPFVLFDTMWNALDRDASRRR